MVRDSMLASIAPIATGEILVVADDATRKLVLHHVSILGLQVAQAETVERALGIAGDKAGTLDCIVVDTALRSVDSYELARWLRAEPENGPLTLEITGPEGAKAFVAENLGLGVR